MRSTRHPTYVSGPWPTRRPVLTLWLTSFIFVTAAVSRSASAQSVAERVIKACVHYGATALAALGYDRLLLAEQERAVPAVATTAPKPKSVPAARAPISENEHKYSYLFEGRGTFDGKPFPNASVLVKISTPHGSFVQGATTDADGYYSVPAVVTAAPNDPIDFTVEAYTPDFEKVEIVGRRIAMREDYSVIVQKPLDFLPS
jgi:hypothetical protein